MLCWAQSARNRLHSLRLEISTTKKSTALQRLCPVVDGLLPACEQRDKTIDMGIWVADLAAIVCAIYLSFVR
jgi:hypothetical protein